MVEIFRGIKYVLEHLRYRMIHEGERMVGLDMPVPRYVQVVAARRPAMMINIACATGLPKRRGRLTI